MCNAGRELRTAAPNPTLGVARLLGRGDCMTSHHDNLETRNWIIKKIRGREKQAMDRLPNMLPKYLLSSQGTSHPATRENHHHAGLMREWRPQSIASMIRSRSDSVSLGADLFKPTIRRGADFAFTFGVKPTGVLPSAQSASGSGSSDLTSLAPCLCCLRSRLEELPEPTAARRC